MLDYHDVTALVQLSEALVGHPHLSHIRELVNRELASMNGFVSEQLKKIKADEEVQRSADERAAADKRIRTEAQARTHQDGKPTPVRNTYEGMPGPAEMGAPTEALSTPKTIPNRDIEGLTMPNPQPELPNIDRRT